MPYVIAFAVGFILGAFLVNKFKNKAIVDATALRIEAQQAFFDLENKFLTKGNQSSSTSTTA